MSEPAHKLLSYAEYLSLEADTGVRHEYFEGAAFAMAGGTPAHAELAGKVCTHLSLALGPSGCRIYTSDLKLFIAPSGLSTYADVAVVCAALERAAHDPNAVTNPSVVVEVLSPSTESYDRAEKFDHYRQLASLQDYVLVSTDQVLVEHRSRGADGGWHLKYAGPGESIQLATHGVTLPVDSLYIGVELEPRPPRKVPRWVLIDSE